MKIFSIIVTYNGMKWIDWCLHSLRVSTIPITPIIIDNGSTDTTLEFISSHYPDAVILPMNSNLGFGQANNKGFEYALTHDATHVLLLNQDAALQPNTIQTLLAHDNGIQLLSPIHLNGKGTKIDRNFKVNTLIKGAINNSLLDDIYAARRSKNIYPVTYVNAACWLMPIEVVKKIGGFNPLFYHYSEDDNYLNRLQYHHIPVLVVTNAFIYHDREIHGSEKMYQKNKVFRRLLVCRTNINFNFAERIKQRYRIAFHTLGEAVSSHNIWLFINDWIWANCKLILIDKKIRYSRKQEKKIQSNWLPYNNSSLKI